jgi:hypothetical protein
MNTYTYLFTCYTAQHVRDSPALLPYVAPTPVYLCPHTATCVPSALYTCRNYEYPAQHLRDPPVLLPHVAPVFQGTQFTCFTSTKVQILTPKALLGPLWHPSRGFRKGRSRVMLRCYRRRLWLLVDPE